MGTKRNKKTQPVLPDGPGGASVNTAPTAETDAEIVSGAHTSFLYPPRTNEQDTSAHKHTPPF